MRYLAAFLLLVPLIFFQNCSEEVGFSQSQNVAPSGQVGDQQADANNSGNDSTLDIPDGDNDVDVIGDNGGRDPDDTLVEDEVNNELEMGDEDNDLVIIKDLCDTQAKQFSLKDFNFPKPNRTCDWEMDGNLEERNQYFQARIEQHRSLGLPAGAVICDAKFEFEKQDFLYDDHFILLFNKKVIASSYDFSSKFDRGNFNLLSYDWSKMAGMYWDNSKETIFCPDGTSRPDFCNFPGHDKQGFIEFDFDPDFIKAIMSEGIPQDHSFSMVSIGDNDGYDCEHSEVNFDVHLTYVVPGQSGAGNMSTAQ